MRESAATGSLWDATINGESSAYMAAVLWESSMILGRVRHSKTGYHLVYFPFLKGYISWTVSLLGRFKPWFTFSDAFLSRKIVFVIRSLFSDALLSWTVSGVFSFIWTRRGLVLARPCRDQSGERPARSYFTFVVAVSYVGRTSQGFLSRLTIDENLLVNDRS